VYDMYPWDARADGPRTPAPRNSVDNTQKDPATAAVQVALDRRDNGGDAAPPKANPAKASPARANHPAAPATTSRGHK
jgi:hypothetical protein